MAITITSCPELGCDAPAELIDEVAMTSTDGEVVMVRVVGACGHRFVMPRSWLTAPAEPVLPVNRSRERRG
jgi:hypothetical protein